ncbi:MAG: lysylphosphatidylglycerol synthase transmembrane domain-containing protein [Bacteroidota bacterium]
MKSRIIHIAQYVVAVGIGTCLLLWVLQNVSVHSLLEQLGDLHMGWIAASMGISLLSCWFRALRWQLQLEVRGSHASSSSIFTALMVGYFANQLLPRTGELVRCSVLPKQSRSSFPTTFGTVIAERIADLLVLGMLLIAVLLWEYDLLIDYFSQTALADMGVMSLGKGLLIVALFIVLAFMTRQFLLNKEGKWISPLKDMANKLWEGIMSIVHLRAPWKFLAYTGLIWLCYWGMTYVVFLAFPIQLSDAGMTVAYLAGVLMIMGTIGMSMPIPGGIGAYHAVIIFCFAALQIESVVGQGMSGEVFAVAAHGARMLMLLLVGAGAAVVIWFSSSDRLKRTFLLYKERKQVMRKKAHPERL